MKNLFSTMLFLLVTGFIFAQAPQGINYQAVIRDVSGNILTNQNVRLRINIRTASVSGTVAYAETHSAITNAYGLVNLVIGQGTVQTGLFSNLSWGSNSHFAEIQADITGGSNYVTIGTQQLMSVPYALYAEKTNEQQTLTLSGNNLSISNGNTILLPNNTNYQGQLMKQIVPSWATISNVERINCMASNASGTIIYISTTNQMTGSSGFLHTMIHRLEKDINGYFQYTNSIEPFSGLQQIQSLVVLGSQLYFSCQNAVGSLNNGVYQVNLDLSNLRPLSISPALSGTSYIKTLSTDGINLFLFRNSMWESYQITPTTLTYNHSFTFSVPGGAVNSIGSNFCVFDGLNYYANGYNSAQGTSHLIKYDINRNYILDSITTNLNTIGNYNSTYLFNSSLFWNAVMPAFNITTPVQSPVFSINPFMKI
jgi:hypothetical protein